MNSEGEKSKDKQNLIEGQKSLTPLVIPFGINPEEERLKDKQALREELNASLEPVVLSYINKGKDHGYSIIKGIYSDFKVLFGASIIYPELHKQENKGNIIFVRRRGKAGKDKLECHLKETNATKYIERKIRAKDVVLSILKQMNNYTEKEVKLPQSAVDNWKGRGKLSLMHAIAY